ncbi:hypothetical protein F4825DRAFT_242774 [Nemania diffusa]|nr:hypothetical protein F4825DRAFT_242774 [Nemania diffusa]
MGELMLVQRPLIFGILWQCFGAAIALPLYFALHLPLATSRSAVCVHDSDQAFAITSSFLLGAILPALAGMGAPWSGAPGRTALAHQLILGIWQPDPIWVCGIQMAISWISRVVRSPSYKEDLQADRRAYDWIRNAYFFASMVSGFGHLYTVWRCLTDNTDEINFTRMYVPWPFKSLSGGDENVLIYGTWLFLQYDFLIISLSSLSWAYFLLRANTSLGRAMSATTLATVLFLAAVMVGPGTTVSLALWYREMELRKVPKARLN